MFSHLVKGQEWKCWTMGLGHLSPCRWTMGALCVCLCVCSPVHKALFFFLLASLRLAIWLLIFITPNHFLISGPSAAQLAATYNSKGRFHITWQRALPWDHFWPLAERANVLLCALHYNLGQLWMWLYCPTEYPKYFGVMFSVCFVFHKVGVFIKTPSFSVPTLCYCSQTFSSLSIPRLGLKETAVPLDFYSWLSSSSFFAPLSSLPFSLTYLNRSRK